MTTTILPPARPEIARETALAWMGRYAATDRLALVARRGYYRDTMGQPGQNDINIYDDAICLVTPDGGIQTWNANTDPSRLRPGVAVLEPGRYLYRVGIHGITRPVERQYEALVQAQVVTVRRHERGLDTGWFGINIHRGSRTTTSSEGCQTIHPDQWSGFLAAVKRALAASSRTTIPYILVAREDA